MISVHRVRVSFRAAGKLHRFDRCQFRRALVAEFPDSLHLKSGLTAHESPAIARASPDNPPGEDIKTVFDDE
jgi:hypothetical protein